MKFYIAYLKKNPHYGTYAEKEIPGSKMFVFAKDIEQAKSRVENSLATNENYTDVWDGNIKECVGFKLITDCYGNDTIKAITE